VIGGVYRVVDEGLQARVGLLWFSDLFRGFFGISNLVQGACGSFPDRSITIDFAETLELRLGEIGKKFLLINWIPDSYQRFLGFGNSHQGLLGQGWAVDAFAGEFLIEFSRFYQVLDSFRTG